jgi:phage shock protein E
MRFIIAFFAVLFSFVSPAQSAITNVDAAGFKKLVDEKKHVLIDLRTDDEIARKGKISGATQINFLGKDAEQQIKKLDKNKTYLIYCAGGGRSADCADMMQAEGFRKIVNLEKGFDDWKKRGFAVEQK